MNEGKILYLFLGIFFSILFLLNYYTQFLVWDEVAFLANAKLLVGEANYREDWFRPPLISFLIGSSWIFTGKSLLVAKIITIFLTTFCVWVFYKVASLYFRHYQALFLTILFSLSQPILYWGFRIYTDIPSVAFLLLSFYWIKKGKFFHSGIATSISFLFRFVSAIFVFPVFISLMITKLSRRKKLKVIEEFGFGFLIPLTVWAIFNSISYGSPFFQFQQNLLTAAKWTAHFTQPVWQQLLNLLSLMNFLLPFLIIGIIKLLRRREWEDRIPYFYLTIFIIFYFFIVKLKEARYWISILPWLYVWIGAGILSVWNWKKIWVLRLFILITVAGAIILPLPQLFNTLRIERSCWSLLNRSISYVQTRVNSNDRVFSDFWPYFGFFTNSTIIMPQESFYTFEELKKLIEETKPTYVITRGGIRGFEELPKVMETGNYILDTSFENYCGRINVYRYIQ